MLFVTDRLIVIFQMCPVLLKQNPRYLHFLEVKCTFMIIPLNPMPFDFYIPSITHLHTVDSCSSKM